VLKAKEPALSVVVVAAIEAGVPPFSPEKYRLTVAPMTG
jgi:hypothetical protein